MKQIILAIFIWAPVFLFTQNSCDSVIVVSLKLDPLNSDRLIIHVENNSTTLFNYPGWRVKDSNNNLVGEEVVNFFGIGQESTHVIPHSMGQLSSGEVSNLILELWTGFYSDLACTYEFNDILYDIEECGEIQLSFWYSSQLTQQISVGLRDSDFNLVFFDVIDNDSIPYNNINLCLVEDCYSLLIEPAASFIFDQDILFQLMTSDAWVVSPSLTLELDSGTSSQAVNFPIYYGDCSTGLEEIEQEPIVMIALNGFLSFTENQKFEGPYTLKLFDAKGALLYHEMIDLDHKIRLPNSKIIIAELRTKQKRISQKILNQ